MSDEFKFDVEVDLVVPPGAYPIIRIDFLPTDGTVKVFGYLRDATFTEVEVNGSQDRLELPFNRPKIFVRHGRGIRRLTIEAVGWKDRGCGG